MGYFLEVESDYLKGFWTDGGLREFEDVVFSELCRF